MLRLGITPNWKSLVVPVVGRQGPGRMRSKRWMLLRWSPTGADYPRAPRCGLDHLPDECRYRFSLLLLRRDGCRKRVTPPSVRFLGRKGYTWCRRHPGCCGDAVEPAPRRVGEAFKTCSALTGRPSRGGKLSWRLRSPSTPFWKLARARLVPVVEIVTLPLSLVGACSRRQRSLSGLGAAILRFLRRP